MNENKLNCVAKLRERAAKEKARGRKLGGKKPQAPAAEPKAKDQVNFTDSESRIMPTSVGGFEQAYNAQASVDMDTMLIVGNHVKMSSEFGVISSELLGIGLYLSPILGRPRMARLVPYLIPNSEFRIPNSVSQNPNDKQEVEPALTQLNQLPENLGRVERAAKGFGFFQ